MQLDRQCVRLLRSRGQLTFATVNLDCGSQCEKGAGWDTIDFTHKHAGNRSEWSDVQTWMMQTWWGEGQGKAGKRQMHDVGVL